MRLIDTDETIKQYTQIFVEKYGIECGEMFQGVLKQMPTAYDVDKVVEELGRLKETERKMNVMKKVMVMRNKSIQTVKVEENSKHT